MSGGIDSVVLAHLLLSVGYRFEVAHCNFHLRPGECDRDEDFVRRLTAQWGLQLHVAEFDTMAYASTHHLSVEDAARRLRYSFFARCVADYDNTRVLTAHHRDDAAETFFINLLRGSGINGLLGIHPLSWLRFTDPPICVAHPMLPFSRADIVAYAQAQTLDHVEDSSNRSPDYLRNRIRHELMPLLRSLSPAADDSLNQSIRNLTETAAVYNGEIERVRSSVLHRDGRCCFIMLDDLKALQPLATWLFELLHPFGFNRSQISDIGKSLSRQSGACFYSPTHRLFHERDRLLLTPIGADTTQSVKLHCDVFAIDTYLERFHSLKTTTDVALFDADRVKLPTHLRFWRQGDRFHPFGMRGSRLLSDFFSDSKMTRMERERQWLLCDADDVILWVVGRRTSSCCAVTSNTQRVLRYSLPKEDQNG